jgi:DNA-binding transcriptional LysR family regulator
MALSFSALESFYWVCQLRSFSAAADKLHVSQPTVSYRIREWKSNSACRSSCARSASSC